jgi:DNA-binding SARP family transcriptional activator
MDGGRCERVSGEASTMPAALHPLPRHHVPRPRLVALLREASVAAVVGGGGYGKTVLAHELAHSLGVATVVCRLEPEDGDPATLVAKIRGALRQRGLSDLAESLQLDDVESAVGRFLDALTANDPVLIVLDEAEHARGDAGALVARVARDLPAGARLVLVGRALPVALSRSVPVLEALRLGQPELAFTDEETETLLERSGVEAPSSVAPRLGRLAGGWPLATVLAAERLARSEDPEAELDGLEATPGLVAGLLDGHLASLPVAAAAALRHVVQLPLLSAEMADRVTGERRLVQRAVEAGIPLQQEPDGRVVVPDPIREAMAARAALPHDVLVRAASVYAEEGLGAEAVRLLVASGEAELAAEAAARLTPHEVSRLDVRELRALLAPIAPEALDRHPRALLHLARACEASADRELRSSLLERVSAVGGDDPALAREVDAERARDLVRDGRVAEAAEVAERLLATSGADETQTRVRALHVLARTHAWRGDAEGLAAAEPLLLEAAELYERLGHHTARAHALLALAYDVYTLGGRFDAAVEALDRALVGLPGRSRLRGVVLVFRAEALIDLGRLTEAEATLAEAERLGALFADTRTLGYTAWLRARAAAPFGDADRVRAQLVEAERHRGAWFEHHSGAEFLAEAALLLDQVGDEELAAAYLVRARDRQDEAPRYVRLAVGAAAARHGDPSHAEETLSAVAAMPDLETREQWRVSLLRAWAAQRAGDRSRAASLARDAFAAVERTGAPDLPLRREPAIAAGLLPLLDAPDDVLAPGAPANIAVLGGFVVRRAEESPTLPAGRPTALVKVLALRAGRMTADEAIEVLWGEVAPASGRKRLRNVLNRLRASVGDLVVRDADVLALPAGTEIDAVLFERAALGALADPAAATAPDRARSALALYAGEVLPDDRYEDWAVEPRERLRARALSLLDLLADRAEAEGDLDEALRLLGRGIELDRLDESRYVRSARLLLHQGRRSRALDVLRAGARGLHELGLEPSEEHRALVRRARG